MGIYSRYQYESLQNRLDTNKLIMFKLNFMFDQVFLLDIYGKFEVFAQCSPNLRTCH